MAKKTIAEATSIEAAEKAVAVAADLVVHWAGETATAEARQAELGKSGASIVDNPDQLRRIAAERAELAQAVQLCTDAWREAQERHLAARRALAGAQADALQHEIGQRETELAEHNADVAVLTGQLRDLTGCEWKPIVWDASRCEYRQAFTMADQIQADINADCEKVAELRSIESGTVDLVALDAAAADRAARDAEQAAYEQMIEERRIRFEELLAELREHGVVQKDSNDLVGKNGETLDYAQLEPHETPETTVSNALLSAAVEFRPGVDAEWRQRVLTDAGECMAYWSFVDLAAWMDKNPKRAD